MRCSFSVHGRRQPVQHLGGGGYYSFVKKMKSMVVYACANLCVRVHVCRCCFIMSEQCNFNAVCWGLGHILFCVPASAVTASLHVINSSVQERKRRKKEWGRQGKRKEAEGESRHVRSQLHEVCKGYRQAEGSVTHTEQKLWCKDSGLPAGSFF